MLKKIALSQEINISVKTTMKCGNVILKQTFFYLQITLAFLMLALACAVSSQSNKLRRQIFDTIDFNSGYKGAKIPARQNQIQPSGKGTKVTGYVYNTPSTTPDIYLPPVTKKPSTPGPKYLIPQRNYTTVITTSRPLGTFPIYTGTYPTYKTSTYKYTYTGTYPPPPPTMKPLTTTTTTPKPIGYVYNQPSLIFDNEEVRGARG